jgi:high-affinity iron transporter
VRTDVHKSRSSAASRSARCSIWRPFAVALALLPARVIAQEANPVQRVANIVSVAVEEYKKGIDAKGRLISADEYQEAVGFLTDARDAAGRLPGDKPMTARIVLDSIIAAVNAKKPPETLDSLNARFAAALGSEAALALPAKPINVAEGARVYAASCALCHGERGLGDGPAGLKLTPRPPAIGTKEMASVSPATMFRKISVGVTGTAMPAFSPQLTDDQRWNVVAYLATLRSSATEVAEGEGLYVQGCVSCHGMNGVADGNVARALSKLPTDLATIAWQAERSDSQIALAVSAGMAGTPMPPSSQLTPAQVKSVVAYLRSLPMQTKTVSSAAGPRDSAARAPEAAARASILLLEQSLTAIRGGRASDASDRAFDAYLAFEPIESRARARDPGVVASMEKLFTDFKGAVRANDLRTAERSLDAIESNMPKVVELTRPTGSASEAFLQSLLIILREGFEAILVIGAVVAFLLKTGHRERLRSIWMGIGLGLVASGLTAVILRTVLLAIPASQDIIEGVTLLVAVAVLFSVSYWLISRVEAAKWQQFIREKVTNALEHGGGRALAFVAFLAVYREGAETALFYQALFNEGSHVILPITLGIVVGFGALGVIFTLFYKYGVRIPLRPFFSVTSVLLYYMAFVFTGTAIRELQEGNAMSITLIRGLPTVPAIGLYPTWETVVAQLVLLALFVFALAKTFWPKRSVTLPVVAPAPADSSPLMSQINALRAENETLKARLTSLEAAMDARTSGVTTE